MRLDEGFDLSEVPALQIADASGAWGASRGAHRYRSWSASNRDDRPAFPRKHNPADTTNAPRTYHHPRQPPLHSNPYRFDSPSSKPRRCAVSSRSATMSSNKAALLMPCASASAAKAAEQSSLTLMFCCRVRFMGSCGVQFDHDRQLRLPLQERQHGYSSPYFSM